MKLKEYNRQLCKQELVGLIDTMSNANSGITVGPLTPSDFIAPS